MEEKQTKPSPSPEGASPAPAEKGADGIDFGSISALSHSEFVPEKWYVSLGYSVLEGLMSFGLFILGFLLDIVKALWQVIKAIVLAVVVIGKGIYKGVRKLVRMFREGDSGVKLSYLINGYGNFKVRQYADGVIFLAVEIVFILFMVMRGGQNLVNFVLLGEDGFGTTLENNSSIQYLIAGIFTIIIILAYCYVWYSSVRSAYDGYIIMHNYDFLAAKEDALYVYENADEFPEIYTKKEKVVKGETVMVDVVASPSKVFKLMREKYGYSYLSSLYISYVPFKRGIAKDLGPIAKFRDNVVFGVYGVYAKEAKKLKGGKFSSVFAKYLGWNPMRSKNSYGFEVVLDELSAAVTRHRHTFDKYNNYIPVVRDLEGNLAVLADLELLEKAIYAEDPASVRNGLNPIAHGEVVKPKVAASRIIGATGCSYSAALHGAKAYNVAQALSSKEGRPVLEILAEQVEKEKHELEEFVETNKTKRDASIVGIRKAYASYSALRADFDQGEKVFCLTLVQEYGLLPADAKMLYRDYAMAVKGSGDDEAVAQLILAQKASRYETVAALYGVTPFHGQPMHFAKKAKSYLDEKFAVTVLAFPVLGAVVFSFLPLIFSVITAFTNYNYTKSYNHVALGLFDWSMDGFAKLFGMTSNSSSLVPTFGYILGWTIVWAFFATFVNYILGIVLALMINNKHIKLKKMWRTLFTISIAIPQFITLLAMSKILGPSGPINTWFYQNGWCDSLSTFWLNDTANNALAPKICLILVNCWIGIPYTMISTSGILMNIPEDLYESARIDGASPWTQFWKITMPYILFVTGPSLLTTFIGNINNFNVIYFLTGGGPSSTVMSSVQLKENAQLTDLLITWLYKMTVNSTQPKYATGAVLGILIFAICAFFSLIVYKRLGSTQNEEAFQ